MSALGILPGLTYDIDETRQTIGGATGYVVSAGSLVSRDTGKYLDDSPGSFLVPISYWCSETTVSSHGDPFPIA